MLDEGAIHSRTTAITDGAKAGRIILLKSNCMNAYKLFNALC
jgi:hypothetical protein